jgi:hypothetical protein
MVIEHHPNSQPRLGNAGLSPADRRRGYRATLCLVSESGEFVDVHLTAEHLRHLATLLEDRGERFIESDD